MSPQNTANRPQRGFAPRIEGLEIREVLSTSAMIATGSLLASSGGGLAVQSASSPLPLLYRPFQARYQGSYVIGAPRAAGQFSQTYMFGGGNSSAFLHGDLELGLSTPSDPAQPVTGQAVLIVKNVSNTGNVLIVDLTAIPGAVDHRGRPTQFTWTFNPASGGIFTNGDGRGTMSLIYSSGRFPGLSHLKQARGSGHLGVIFRGTLGTTNLNSTLRNQ